MTTPAQYVGPFDIVYCDAPWRYSFSRSSTRKIENHYSTMRLCDIEALGPRIPAADNSILFLWATAPKLLEALSVMKAWDFKYVTQAVWDKQIMGMGYWFRGQHEILLLGKRGKFPPPEPKARHSSVFSERRTKHSKKPAIVRAHIDAAYPGARKLEMFARPPAAPGWFVWGNEIVDDPQAVILEGESDE